MLRRMRMSVLGEPAKEQCECGKEYDLFPNQPIKLDTAQVSAAKYEISKIYPDLSPQDLSEVSDEPKTNEEIAQSLLSILTEDKLKDMVRTDINKARSIGQDLVELSSSKVRAIA